MSCLKGVSTGDIIHYEADFNKILSSKIIIKYQVVLGSNGKFYFFNIVDPYKKVFPLTNFILWQNKIIKIVKSL